MYSEKVVSITFIAETTNTKTKKRKSRERKIILFNPPYCLIVKTNVRRIFLKFIKKHFPKDNNLNKIFNKNTVQKLVIAVRETFHPSFCHTIRIF